MRIEGTPTTFRELQECESPNPDDVVATFGDYVKIGASIDASTVIEVIQKSNAELRHLGMIGEAVGVGMRDQQKRGFPKDAEEFAHVGRFVTTQVNQLSSINPEE